MKLNKSIVKNLFKGSIPLQKKSLNSVLKPRKLFDPNTPKPKRIILMRHGESLANLDKSIHTHTPDYKISLTKTGRNQAFEAGSSLANIIPINESVKFWVSPYYRTRETFEEVVKSFASHRHITYIEEIRLREQEWGNFQNEEVIRKVSEERWKYGHFYYRFPNGESGSDVYDRVSAFLETLYRNFGRADNMIIISHGVTCRMFLMRWYKWPVKLYHRLENLENANAVIMELHSDGKYRIKTPLYLRKNSEVGFPPDDFHKDIHDKIQIKHDHNGIHFNDDPVEDEILFEQNNTLPHVSHTAQTFQSTPPPPPSTHNTPMQHSFESI